MTEHNLEHIQTKEDWEQALQQFPEANFLQSWQWGVFERALGKTVFALAYQASHQTQAVALAVVETAKRGTYLTIAGGPLLDWSDTQLVQQFFAQVSQLARQHDCWFIRFRPQVLESQVSAQVLSAINAHQSPMHLTADLTLELDLHQSEEELLAQMRKNTRSSIRKADRLGIHTSISSDENEVNRFYQQQLELAARHGFVPFGREFLQAQFRAFLEDDCVALIHSWQGTELLASAFVLFYNGEAVYHYGVSTPANATLPGSYATQWAAILEAKRRGCRHYNFWGVAPQDQPDHRFAGVSLFKHGFGGETVQYLPAQDISLKPQYWVTFAFEQLRKKLRKL